MTNLCFKWSVYRTMTNLHEIHALYLAYQITENDELTQQSESCTWDVFYLLKCWDWPHVQTVWLTYFNYIQNGEKAVFTYVITTIYNSLKPQRTLNTEYVCFTWNIMLNPIHI
jgi:hypothetical protein